jgi:flagellar secretion chaperone FliS
MFTSPSSRSAMAYKRVGVETSVDHADPHKLVSMLFDALRQALAAAGLAMKNGDLSAKIKHVNHALRILDEGLKAPLDLQQGGELASNLHALYEYCTNRLVVANARNDVAAIEEISGLVEQVASGWKQIGPASKSPAYLQPV